MTQQLMIYQNIGDPVEAAIKIGERFAKSGLIALPNADAGFVVAMDCMAQNMTLSEYEETYHFIKGKKTMKADAMVARFLNAGGKHQVVEANGDVCHIIFKWDGNKYDRKLTWEEAQQARWPWKNQNDHSLGFKDNWSTPADRENMLFARLVSKELRRLAPNLFKGQYTPEEIQDDDSIVAPIAVVQRPQLTADEAVAVAAARTVTQQSPAQAQLPPPAPTVAPADRANLIQVGRFDQLVKELDVEPAKVDEILGKRGVDNAADLSKSQIDEIIQRFEVIALSKK